MGKLAGAGVVAGFRVAWERQAGHNQWEEREEWEEHSWIALPRGINNDEAHRNVIQQRGVG